MKPNELPDEITLVPQPSKSQLNQRQLLDYRNHREDLTIWLLAIGKNPHKADGYSVNTVKTRIYRMDQFYRWVWDKEDRYTTDVTHSHADEYVEELAYGNKSNAHKNNCLKALKMLYKWRHHELGENKWEPDMTFKVEKSNPQDYFTMKERKLLREAALEYGSIPGYNDLTPSERDRWKAYLAQKFGKPKNQVKPSDWDRANGWKITSLVWTSLDAGLRPVEVENAVTSWVDLDNNVLRIPKEDSSKNRDNWIVSLQERTAEALANWMQERRVYDKYSDTDKLWLTKEANPYQTTALSYILQRLCEIAGIETENRKISWYAIRHSVGTYMTHVEDLGAAQAQLRHESEKTTMKYDQAPVEERRDALDKMG